jgi:PAS domain S-box-containing protein
MNAKNTPLCKSCEEEEKMARSYLEVAGVMIVVLGKDGEVKLINKRGCEILGFCEDEIKGKNWFDVCLPKEVIPETKKVFEQLMSGEIESVEYHENSILRKDGEARLIAFHNALLKNESGEIEGILFSGEDVTEQKEAEKKIISQRNELQGLNDIMLGREMKMIEMKKRITELEKALAECQKK